MLICSRWKLRVWVKGKHAVLSRAGVFYFSWQSCIFSLAASTLPYAPFWFFIQEKPDWKSEPYYVNIPSAFPIDMKKYWGTGAQDAKIGKRDVIHPHFSEASRACQMLLIMMLNMCFGVAPLQWKSVFLCLPNPLCTGGSDTDSGKLEEGALLVASELS